MILFLDVETNGLFGEAFAVGWVLTSADGFVLREGVHSCPYFAAEPDRKDSTPLLTEDFLKNKVLPALPTPNCSTVREVRDHFFDDWLCAWHEAQDKKEELYIVADVPFPCETRFLNQVRQDDRRGYLIVYPLLDVASVLLAKGYDPTGVYPRRENELPAHNPLNDARQSGRIFHQVMKGESITDG